ncbi:MAG: MmcQ/YjbR family DNA-binding protein [Chloroflexi bacterium]|nr:MAG: MmcQ/YjbR family DNA-binding protein [Chloroflexota bacterium]MBL1193276.1 MmcQ/YjbR family DNA-binding protein [Chloroflexota bacterium]NOH10568.1 MmcQ/YjbR family DNA-binding protein [Chloroflexota bacterium]
MDDVQLERVRRLCLRFPEAWEKLSHGEPNFFTGKRVFTSFAGQYHEEGRAAIWVPAPPGDQEFLIEHQPEVFFKPPYVGHRGWVGIELERIDVEDLSDHIETAWRMIATKKLQKSYDLGEE